MNTNIINLTGGLLTFVVLGITGCGGDSGSSASVTTLRSSFTGNTSQAVVTVNNGKVLSSDAYQGVQTVSSAAAMKEAANNSQPSPPRVQELSAMLESSIQAAVKKSFFTGKVVTATVVETINGASGYYNYNIEVDQTTGVYSGHLIFYQYKPYIYSAAISGSVDCHGAYDLSNQIFTSLNITMDGLSGTRDGSTETITGTISIGQMNSTKSVTISAVLLDVGANSTYWFNNLIFTFVETSLTVSGTYYNPIHGYVVISTVTPLASSAFANIATSGRLLFTGKNGSKARLTFSNSGKTVEVDTTGNDDFVMVSAATTLTLGNQQKTQLLLGNWIFSYNIASAWTDKFTLNNVFPSTDTPGDYAISGTNEYGGVAVGSYISKYGIWAILDGGTIVDQFYEFKTDGDSVLSGCYYLIQVYTGEISRCYPLTGGKNSSAAKQVVSDYPADSDKIKIGEAQFGIAASKATLEQYRLLNSMSARVR